MLRLLSFLTVGAAVVLLAACGDGEKPAKPQQPRPSSSAGNPISSTPARRVSGFDLVPVPRQVTALCRRAGQPKGQPVYGGPRHPLQIPSYRRFPPRFPIYCPARLPLGVEADQNLAHGRSAYQWEVTFHNDVLPRRYGAPHAVLGGQQAPFPLGVAPRRTWPPPGMRGAMSDLRWPAKLRVVALAAVRNRSGLALRFPASGTNSAPNAGHLAVVFNLAGRGYFVSVHFDRLSDHSRIRLASEIADWLELQRRLPSSASGPGAGQR